ncbi:hypothetical protein DFH06DRAFT_1150670 [Mycena polygramma]|nr:hypothetical protein DFH06DRAFT_1150670 [Mycena polygramma]
MVERLSVNPALLAAVQWANSGTKKGLSTPAQSSMFTTQMHLDCLDYEARSRARMISSPSQSCRQFPPNLAELWLNHPKVPNAFQPQTKGCHSAIRPDNSERGKSSAANESECSMELFNRDRTASAPGIALLAVLRMTQAKSGPSLHEDFRDADPGQLILAGDDNQAEIPDIPCSWMQYIATDDPPGRRIKRLLLRLRRFVAMLHAGVHGQGKREVANASLIVRRFPPVLLLFVRVINYDCKNDHRMAGFKRHNSSSGGIRHLQWRPIPARSGGVNGSLAAWLNITIAAAYNIIQVTPRDGT